MYEGGRLWSRAFIAQHQWHRKDCREALKTAKGNLQVVLRNLLAAQQRGFGTVTFDGVNGGRG